MGAKCYKNLLKKQKKLNEKLSKKGPKRLPKWVPGRETTMPIWHTFRPWGALGSQSGPKTPPKRFWDSPNLDFSWFWPRFSLICQWFLVVFQRIPLMFLGSFFYRFFWHLAFILASCWVFKYVLPYFLHISSASATKDEQKTSKSLQNIVQCWTQNFPTGPTPSVPLVQRTISHARKKK